MSDQTDTITSQLSRLGLTDEEARIYLYMAEKQAVTALEMSKYLHIGRTKVYRILDKLYSVGLTEQRLGPRGYLFEIKSPDFLQNIL